MTRLKHSSAQTRRCSWVNADDVLLVKYHDREWGIPAHSDHKHFEVLILSGVQAGLNWSLVLKKRDGYRRAFKKFDPEKVARYSEMQIRKLLSDPEIIRNRMKIEAAVRNAHAFLKVQEEFGKYDSYCWRFVDGRPERDVCLHAGDRNGERSHRGLLPLSGNRSGVCRCKLNAQQQRSFAAVEIGNSPTEPAYQGDLFQLQQ